MKLITFDASLASTRKGDSKITMGKTGLISITKDAVQLMGLKAGDRVSIHQDEDNPEDWYLSLDENGYELRDFKNAHGLCFNATTMRKMMLEALGLEVDETQSFKFGTIPTELKKVNYWPILTSSR